MIPSPAPILHTPPALRGKPRRNPSTRCAAKRATFGQGDERGATAPLGDLNVSGNLSINAQVDTQTIHTDTTVDLAVAIGDTAAPQLTTLTDTTTETATGGQLTAGGTINLLAGHDLDLTGVATQAGGDLIILAGHDLHAGSLATHSSERIQKLDPSARPDENGIVQDIRADTTTTATLAQHGGQLNANGDITLNAGHGNPFSPGMVSDVQTARTAAGMHAQSTTGITPRIAAHSEGPGEAPGKLTLDGINITAGTATARSDINLVAAGAVSINGLTDSTTITHDPLSGQGPLVTATNPSGHLAGNNISIHSDQSGVTLNALDLHAKQDLSLHSGGTTQIDSTTLTAGRDLRINSTGDLTAQGSDFTAGQALSLISAGNLSISGSTDHQQTGGKNDLHIRDTGKASTLTGQTITLAGVGERVTDAEGKVTGSNINLTHVALTSTGQTLISATGDIAIDPGTNYAYDYQHESHSSGFIVEKTTTTDHLVETTTILASTVKAGSLDVLALGDIKITATEFDLKGDSSIQAAGKIDYLAAHNQTRNQDDSHTSRRLLGHEYKSSTDHHDSSSRTALVTSIQSQADVLSHSDGDTTMQGTHIETTGHVHIEAKGNLKLDAVEDSANETQYQEHYDRIKEGGIKPVVHARDHDESGTFDTTLTGTRLHGDKLTLVAGGNITGTAADLVAKNGGDLYAGGGILLDAGQETHTTRHRDESTSIGYSTVKTDGRTHIAGANHNTTDDQRSDTITTSIGSHLDGGAGKITTHSGGDTLILGSKIEAQAGIDLYAGGKLSLGGSTSNSSQNHVTDTGTFIGKASDGLDYQDSTTTNHATELVTHGDIKLHGTEQIILGNADFKSGGKTILDTPNLLLTPESNLTSRNRQDWDKDRGYTTSETHGKLDESLTYAKFDAKGGLVIDKNTKVSIVVDTHGQTPASPNSPLSTAQYQDIAKQLAAQPGMGYLKDLAGRSDIDWQAVKTAHQKWDYSGQGMTQEGAIVLVIVVAIFTYGAGAELAGAGTATTTTATGATVTTTTTLGAVANAGFTSLATSAAIAVANNGGDLGKALHDLGKTPSRTPPPP